MKMGVFSKKISRKELKPGDHIYSWRYVYVYAHHGIYIGDGKVIHFTQPQGGREIGAGTVLDRIIFSSLPPKARNCSNCGDQSSRCGVICSCLDCFLADCDLYLFQYAVSRAFFVANPRGGTCTTAAPDPSSQVLHRAFCLLNNGFGDYHLFSNNCEDFAIYCKTGLRISGGRSGQATSFFAAASNIVSSYLTTSFTGLTAVGYGMYCLNRLMSDIGVRRDVEKVPVERLVSASFGFQET